MVRAALSLPLPLLLLAVAGCDVTKDPANDTVSVEYDANEAREAGAAVARTAENVAGEIGEDVKREGAKLGEAARDVQVKAGDAADKAGAKADAAGDRIEGAAANSN